eukprot:gb/GEZN01007644.1/.p1 GENE.gb/GEZN01007644.1/~~gb/GEZN01007644.1/.p1  ORF type:complete len:476 (-),score=67.87 gb/GEZN01007644.1/:92-1498(-)
MESVEEQVKKKQKRETVANGSDTSSEKRHQTDNFSIYYGLLSHQQNMLQDSIRTGLYQQAFLAIAHKFQGKVVLDVGTGSGILAHFAVQAGAKKVYAVEASAVSERARILLAANGLSSKITVLRGKAEELDLPEKVDIIVSEPMGILLLHERMIESFLAARQKHLKQDGLMLPSMASIYVCPFTDNLLHQEQVAKASFWTTRDFFGLDMTSMYATAVEEHLSQPVVGPVEPASLLSPETASSRIAIDFRTASPEDLHDVTLPFRCPITKAGDLHGMACWFDVLFLGLPSSVPSSSSDGLAQTQLSPPVVLSTAPSAAMTHWYQTRLLFHKPLPVKFGQVLSGRLRMVGNKHSSYSITLFATLSGINSSSSTFEIKHDYELQNVLFRCYWPEQQQSASSQSDFSKSGIQLDSKLMSLAKDADYVVETSHMNVEGAKSEAVSASLATENSEALGVSSTTKSKDSSRYRPY